MAGLVIDTHTLIWYLTSSPRLSPKALARIEATMEAGDPVYVPAISLIEVIYLVEKGRLPVETTARITERLNQTDSGLVIAPLDRAVAEKLAAIPREEIPDMPDRIIAATASMLGLPLVTKDGRIRSSVVETFW
jgi:PIN domain nuclease of toxin-antitoxin system